MIQIELTEAEAQAVRDALAEWRLSAPWGEDSRQCWQVLLKMQKPEGETQERPEWREHLAVTSWEAGEHWCRVGDPGWQMTPFRALDVSTQELVRVEAAAVEAAVVNRLAAYCERRAKEAQSHETAIMFRQVRSLVKLGEWREVPE